MTNEKKYQVPAPALAAAMENAPEDLDPLAVALILQAFIKHQSENPPIPTEGQAKSIREAIDYTPGDHRQLMAEWIRRMYLTPEPELKVPSAIKDLLVASPIGRGNMWNGDEFNAAVLEAFRRGQQSIPTSTPLPQSILEEREIEAHNARCAEFLKNKRAKLASWPTPTPLARVSTIDLRWHDDPDPRAEGHNNGILEAFRRGQQSQQSK